MTRTTQKKIMSMTKTTMTRTAKKILMTKTKNKKIRQNGGKLKGISKKKSMAKN